MGKTKKTKRFQCKDCSFETDDAQLSRDHANARQHVTVDTKAGR